MRIKLNINLKLVDAEDFPQLLSTMNHQPRSILTLKQKNIG
jgi:hypothetical protein